jgi:hypothetical protein
MSEDPKPKTVNLTIRAADYASANLNARIVEFLKRDAYIELDPWVKSIQFLRGVSSRASFVLPALYSHIGVRRYRSRIRRCPIGNASK